MFIRFFALFLFSISCFAQTQNAYVKEGVVYLANGEELQHFGFNYNAPFAFTFRAIGESGVDHKKAIDMDIRHMKRIGADAYRVHVWDREISDSEGNLLDNEHLELLDYLLVQLAENEIKAIVTPIAWWGNGYPAPETPTLGFSNLYTKEQMNTSAAAIKATHTYLAQFFQHKNRFSGVKYMDDSNIVLFELFNEPRHKTVASESKVYLQQLIDLARDIGVQKPLFYNISEQGNDQPYAEAICSTTIDGIAYQWYPTGLVQMGELHTNLLANVAHYTDVFAQTNGCHDKPKMVYEFDAADVDNSVMYPAMARSFRQAGFQWATMFSYDPAVIAHTNAEYNTHYLNLLYTPEKAISFLIASQLFKTQTRSSYVAEYPKSNQSENLILDYQQNLSLYDSGQRYYYSSSTERAPKSIETLRHIAGTGSSPVVQYQGSGTYFLDKQADGIWLLEVYPDVHKLQDPHQSSSLKREVSRLYAKSRVIAINLPELGENYWAQGINQGNEYRSKANNASITITPGKYLLSSDDIDLNREVDTSFYLPHLSENSDSFTHEYQRELSVGDKLTFAAQYYSTEQDSPRMSLYLRYTGHGAFTHYEMREQSAGHFIVDVPQQQWQQSGILEYYFGVKLDGNEYSYPGKKSGNPQQWDFVAEAPYRIEYRPEDSDVTLFQPLLDFHNLIYPQNGRGKWQVDSEQNGQRVVELSLPSIKRQNSNWLTRIMLAADNQLNTRDMTHVDALSIKVRGHGDKRSYINFGLLNEDGLAFTTQLTIKPGWQNLVVPLKSLKASPTMLTKAYPKFMPEQYSHHADYEFTADNLKKVQGVQLAFDQQAYSDSRINSAHTVSLSTIAFVNQSQLNVVQ